MSDEEEELGGGDDEGGGEGWIVSFADLMTLLFALFVVLYGLKPEGEDKNVLGVTSSIRESFMEIPDQIPEEERLGPINTGATFFKYFRGETNHEPVIKKFRKWENTLQIVDHDMSKVRELIEDITKTKSKVKPQSTLSVPVTVKQTEGGFKIRFMSSFLYDSGSYRLRREQINDVKRIGTLLKELGRPIIIEGHSDDRPGSEDRSNLEISSLRATYMANFLVKQSGMEPKKIGAAGFGAAKPMADNSTAHGRRMNRRVEIYVDYSRPN